MRLLVHNSGEDLQDSYYWSSTENVNNTNNVYYFNFNGAGSSTANMKGVKFRIRAVREF